MCQGGTCQKISTFVQLVERTHTAKGRHRMRLVHDSTPYDNDTLGEIDGRTGLIL